MLSSLPLSFVTVVETGSITLASETLNIAKSAVSQNLKRLEKELGVKLATRTTRRFNLTPAGERYYQRCKEILLLAERAANEMEDFGASPAGSIRITAPHAMINAIIAPAIYQLKSAYPQLKPTVIADDKRLDLIESGIDLAITVGALQDSSLRAKRIGTLHDVLCASSEVLADIDLTNPKESIEAIQKLPYIAHTREETTKEGFVKQHILHSTSNGETLSATFEPTLFTNTIESALALAQAGAGIALLPDLVINRSTTPLLPVFPDFVIPAKNIYAVHAYDTMPPRSVVETIHIVQKLLGNC